jgi:GntR family histidine utilization transcriptional repressor
VSASARLSWRDVRERIHEAIVAGRYGPGDRLPRDADLAARFNCARTTVQRAMQDLADSGVISRRRRGGTHVRPDRADRATFEIPIIRQEVERSGARYGYHLIVSARTTPPEAVREALAVPGAAPMLRVEAMHLRDDRPHILEERWICLDTVPEAAAVDFSCESANEWLVRNRPYDRCSLQFSAMSGDARIATLLGAGLTDALLVMARTTWLKTDPITTVRAIAAPGYALEATS